MSDERVNGRPERRRGAILKLRALLANGDFDRYWTYHLSQDPIAATRFGLLVDDIDAAHQRALDAGGAEVHPPTDFRWKPRTSCVRDLDGNLIDLSQS